MKRVLFVVAMIFAAAFMFAAGAQEESAAGPKEILRSYFLTIPRNLEESAYLDGAGIFRTFMQIMVPLARPGIATAATITFIDTWKEFFFALLLTTSDRARTLPLSLNYFVHFFSFDYRAMFAALVVVTMPTIFVFIAMQEQVINSLTQGALKG